MTASNHPLLDAAQAAIAAGKPEEARRLLRQYVRREPEDPRGWLWLAGVAPSPQHSLAYLDQAERLSPGDATIAKARGWAESRQHQEEVQRATVAAGLAREPESGGTDSGTVPATDPAVRRSMRRERPAPATEEESATGSSRIVTVAAIVAIIGLVLLVGAILVRSGIVPVPVLAAEPATVAPTPQPAGSEVVVSVEPTLEPTLTASPEVEEVAVLGEVEPTPTDVPDPTPTLAPTSTPVPTATPVPTVVINTGGEDILQSVSVAEGERWINVNLSTQTLTAYEGNQPVFTTLISSGVANHPTVTGQYRIWLRYESQTMNGLLLGYDYYLENVPYVMYFYNDYALHGAYWHNNFGVPMSHGCVNLSVADAEWLYYWSSYGTLVNVHY